MALIGLDGELGGGEAVDLIAAVEVDIGVRVHRQCRHDERDRPSAPARRVLPEGQSVKSHHGAGRGRPSTFLGGEATDACMTDARGVRGGAGCSTRRVRFEGRRVDVRAITGTGQARAANRDHVC